MTKEFVPYAQALALKELGFDEPCFGHWNYNNGKINYWYDEEIQNERTNKWILDSEKQFPKMNKNGCTSPTFSHAFRWFREKHGLCNFINFSGDGFCSGWEDLGNNEHGFENFKTYEEAELACLIKLIEIVKTK